MLTPIDQLAQQKEYPGFGAVSPDADEKIKKTPLA
jgi:NADH-quinone oxidoreductase subunit I